MKIAFVFPPMWTPHSDGSLQIWNREVTTRLAKSFEVLVYSARFGFPCKETVDGVSYLRFSSYIDHKLMNRYVRYFLGSRRPFFSRDLWFPVYAFRVATDLRQQGCDVAHVYNFPQFARWIKRFNPNLRVVLNMHGEWLTQIPFNNLAATLSEIDLIVSCSDFITERTASHFPQFADRCVTVPMGIGLDAFSVEHDANNGARPPRNLLYVGRISPEKGVHDLLDAFELIVREHPDATLTVVGPEWVAPREHIADLCLDQAVQHRLAPFYESSYFSQLKRRLSRQAAERTTFTGLISHREIARYYACADVYVSPSLYESFGMSVIEAMAAGVPVVATRVGAVPQLIADQRSGLIVEPGDPAAIAGAVQRFFSDSKLRASAPLLAHETARLYAWDNICSTLSQRYESLTKN